MARNLTEDEVKWIEERRRQQEQQRGRDYFESKMSDEERGAIDQRRQEMAEAAQRQRVNAMHTAAADWRRNGQTQMNDRFNDTVRSAQQDAMEQRRRRILANPSAETDTKLRNFVLRQAELDAAHERGMDVHKGEWNTRIEEAEKKRLGMEEQGADAATIRANADKDMLGLTLGDKEKQRAHELSMLGQTQTFQGTQNDAERKNRLEVAGVQGKSAVDAARAQAEARAADIAAKNNIEREKIEARKQIAAMRENGRLSQAGAARLSKTYTALAGAGYSPARIRQLLLDEGWSAEEIASAQGRQ